jgi:hypothetical protein
MKVTTWNIANKTPTLNQEEKHKTFTKETDIVPETLVFPKTTSQTGRRSPYDPPPLAAQGHLVNGYAHELVDLKASPHGRLYERPTLCSHLV